MRLTQLPRAGMVRAVSDFERVNLVPIEELPGWLDAAATALLGDPHDPHFASRIELQRRKWQPDRVWGARSRGRWVATLVTEPHRFTVPGRAGRTYDVAADALTGVSVAATHRRQGLLTQMLTESLAAAKDRGDPLGILVAAEWPIYGRFGYAPAVSHARFTYYPRLPTAKVTASSNGTMRQVEAEEFGRIGAEVFETARLERAGQIDRSADWWAFRCGYDGFEPPHDGGTPRYLVHEGTDGVDGLLSWKVTRDLELDGSLGRISVPDLVAANSDAYRDLWAYLSSLDLVERIELRHRPIDEPVRWLLADGRALRQTYAGDHTWVRLLDVPAALSARGYAVPGRLVLDVVGDGQGYANGCYVLDADADGASCISTTLSPDLRVSAQALAATYLGGHTLRALAIGGDVEELSSGAMARADAMFATDLAPWNSTVF